MSPGSAESGDWSRWLDECGSTNDVARTLAEAGAPSGSWVAARRQSSGRGRAGREWKSTEGNLHLSVVLRPDRRELWTWIPLAAAVAAARAAEAVAPAARGALRIKWPNDLAVDGAKLGGILCEASGGAGVNGFVIVGVGLNVAGAPALADRATAALSSLGAKAGLEPLAEGVRWALVQECENLEAHGPDGVEEAFWSRAWRKKGENVEWDDAEGGGSGSLVGLGPAGELVVQLIDGRERRLISEEVRLGSS
ncbi:MAG: biotin--[acetyl-CoA-carboxylase] ligase [Bdellovibrionales bacterium]|nr:biotin--[acetyl-CoA-carboxylase] ligase [Bdellovibrionales bacterium]